MARPRPRGGEREWERETWPDSSDSSRPRGGGERELDPLILIGDSFLLLMSDEIETVSQCMS